MMWVGFLSSRAFFCYLFVARGGHGEELEGTFFFFFFFRARDTRFVIFLGFESFF